MRMTLQESGVLGLLSYCCENDDGERMWESLIPDTEPAAYFNQSYPVVDLRKGAKGELLTAMVPAATLAEVAVKEEAIAVAASKLPGLLAAAVTSGTIVGLVEALKVVLG